LKVQPDFQKNGALRRRNERKKESLGKGWEKPAFVEAERTKSALGKKPVSRKKKKRMRKNTKSGV